MAPHFPNNKAGIQHAEKMACLTSEEIESRLKAAGVQPTLQRISICKHVLCEADHPSADDVHAWAEKNLAKISLATVYNTLNTLVDAGLLREFRFPHTEKVVYDNNMDDHYHFFDKDTNQLYDIPKDEVEIKWKSPRGLDVNATDLTFSGKIKQSK